MSVEFYVLCIEPNIKSITIYTTINNITFKQQQQQQHCKMKNRNFQLVHLDLNFLFSFLCFFIKMTSKLTRLIRLLNSESTLVYFFNFEMSLSIHSTSVQIIFKIQFQFRSVKKHISISYTYYTSRFLWKVRRNAI